MKKAPTLAEASPYKSVAEELETLRRAFRGVCQRYSERIESEIVQLYEQVVAAGTIVAEQEKTDALAVGAVQSAITKQNATAQTKRAHALVKVHDLRDMLTVLRTLQIKPAEGRRKDMKKVETAIEELRTLVDAWK